MATAISGASSSFGSPRLEKTVIEYLDGFIDARRGLYGADFLVPLVSFQGYVGIGTNEIRTYVGQKKKEVEDFISLRNHVWKVRASNATENAAKMLIVEKQPAELRAALVRVLAYVQRKTEENGRGAKLNNVSVLIGQHFPAVKRLYANGLIGVKTFLLGFPALFTMAPYNPERTEVADIIFKNRAIVAEGVILLPKINDEIESSAGRLDGVGPVVRLFPAYGFVRDDTTKQDAYFTMMALQGVPEETFRRMATDGEKFCFEAYVSREYEAKKTSNKWLITRMWPQSVQVPWERPVSRASVSSSVASGTSSKNLVPKNADNWQGSRKPDAEDIETESGYNSNMALEDYLSKLDDELLTESSADSKTPVQMISLSSVNDHDQKPKPQVVWSNVKATPPPGLTNLPPGFGSTVPKMTPTKAEMVKTPISPPKQQPTVRPDVVPKSSGIGLPKSVNTAPQAKQPEMVDQRQSSTRISTKESVVKTKKVVEKCDASCQTEFNDDRELLLRVLRRSPDLLKLVQAMRGE